MPDGVYRAAFGGVIVQSSTTGGAITLSATGAGLQPAQITINSA